MRFLGIGHTIDLGDMYLRLMQAGHEVRVHVADEESQDVMVGMVEQVSDWRAHLSWIREAHSEGMILFETASDGIVQDELRASGFNVIGGSSLGDRLENDRAFGQKVLAEAGLQTAGAHEFHGFDDAIDFVRSSPARYVFKLSGSGWSSTRNYVGQMENGADIIALLEAQRRVWSFDEEPDGILMAHLSGVEVGVGAFFNGKRFLAPANLDWEHKRFFPGDIGELTGEMGTVVTYRGAEKIFDATLARFEDLLASSAYCGYINLNTIINDQGIWPLEFTARFGYPGFPILDALHDENWDSMFTAMIEGTRTSIETRDGISVGVVLTVPPFPYSDGYAEIAKGTPITFLETFGEEDRDALHFGEVAMKDGQLVAAGMIGYLMVVTGVGAGIEDARRNAYRTVDKVVIPNMRYRNDIGFRYERDRATLRQLGWLE